MDMYTCVYLHVCMCLRVCVCVCLCVCVPAPLCEGAAPSPESLFLSLLPVAPLVAATSDELFSVSPAAMEGLLQACQGSQECVHDSLASKNKHLAQETLQAQQKYRNLSLTFGKHTFGGGLKKTWCSELSHTVHLHAKI